MTHAQNYELKDADLLEEKPMSGLEKLAMGTGCLIATPIVLTAGTLAVIGYGLYETARKVYCNVRGKEFELSREDPL